MQDEVTQADALMQHVLRMIDACANYIEPTTYIARHPVGDLCKWNTEFPMPEATHTPEASARINKRRDDAFIRDMIYMLDGPEQREAFIRHQAERETLARMEPVVFTDGNMVGYGFQAYCAGWKACLLAMGADPNQLKDNHARDWFAANPPAAIEAPTWRVPLPPAPEAGQ